MGEIITTDQMIEALQGDMNISCEVFEVITSKCTEKIAEISVRTLPQRGDYLQFTNARLEYTTWQVLNVLHRVHVGYRLKGRAWQQVIVYVQPVKDPYEF